MESVSAKGSRPLGRGRHAQAALDVDFIDGRKFGEGRAIRAAIAVAGADDGIGGDVCGIERVLTGAP